MKHPNPKGAKSMSAIIIYRELNFGLIYRLFEL